MVCLSEIQKVELMAILQFFHHPSKELWSWKVRILHAVYLIDFLIINFKNLDLSESLCVY